VSQLELAFHPGTESGWIGYALRRTGRVDIKRLPPGAPHSLLARFEGALLESERVKLHLHGELQEVDWHSLPWRGGLLGETHTVTYSADADAARSGPAAPGRAMVVAEPERAAFEGAAVARLLEGSGQRVRLLSGESATREALLQALPMAGLLHFAGHVDHAGRDGWDSALRLAGGASLSVGELLGLSAVPRVVVLSACEGARVERGGLGVAQAFVAAGAELVVAPTRPVNVESAARVALAFHRALSRSPEDPADALRQAQHRLRRTFPEVDAAAFRALVR
jgi:hypothetical protein